MLEQDNNIYLIILSILIICLLDNLWLLKGEVTYESPLGVQGLKLSLKQVHQPDIDITPNSLHSFTGRYIPFRGENYALDPTLPSHWYITFCNWLKLLDPDLLNFIFIVFPSWMRLGLELNSKLNIFTTKQEILINIIRPVYRLTSFSFKIIIKPSMWPNITVQADQKKPSSRTKSNKEEK